MQELLIAAVLLVIAAGTAVSQRPRTTTPTDQPQQSAVAVPGPVKARYEGGVIGYVQKQDGTLVFDDPNGRLVFRTKAGKEMISMPYGSISAAWPDTQSKRPTAATVAGSVPVPYGLNMPAMFIKTKVRYLILQYSDPDTNATGTGSFKLGNKETLAAVLQALAGKAELTARGEGYIRKRPATTP